MRRLTKCQSKPRLQQHWSQYDTNVSSSCRYFPTCGLFLFSFHALQSLKSQVFMSHFCQEQTVSFTRAWWEISWTEIRGFQIGCNASHPSGPGCLKQTSASHQTQSLLFSNVISPTQIQRIDPHRVCCVHVYPILCHQSRAFAPVLLSTGWEWVDSFRRRGMKDYMHHWQMARPPDKCDGTRLLCR